MKHRILLITIILMSVCNVIFALSDGAKITFKHPKKSYYATEEQRGGRSFSIYGREKISGADINAVIPKEVGERSLIWISIDGACAWIKVASDDNISIYESDGRIVSEGGKYQKLNDFLSKWSKMAYFEIENLVLPRIDYMVATSSGVKREYPSFEELFSDENIAKMESLRERSLNLLKKYNLKDKELVKKLESLIKMQNLELYFQNLTSAKEDNKIDDKFFKFLNDIKFDSEYDADYPGFEEVTRGYFSQLDARDMIDYQADNYVSKRAKKIQTQTAKEKYILNELNLIERQGWLYYAPEILKNVKPIIRTEEVKKEFTAIESAINNAIKENAHLIGVPCDDFAFEDRNGNIGKLSDYKGKYVFVDVWATWCGPCKYEIPYLLKLEKELHGKDIQFISLSVDKPKDRNTWLEFISTNDMNGVCLITPDAFNHPLIKRYGINSIPRFLLFDKEGRTIAIKNRRPHDKVMKMQLLDLLK